MVKLPSHEWAECAAFDLATVGCRACVSGPDGDGCWPLTITRTAAQIRAIREPTEPEPAPCSFDWSGCVDTTLAPGPGPGG